MKNPDQIAAVTCRILFFPALLIPFLLQGYATVTPEPATIPVETVEQVAPETGKYAIVKTATPVFYTGNMASIFYNPNSNDGLHLDEYSMVDELETVLLPGSVVKIEGVTEEQVNDAKVKVYRITTAEYPDAPPEGKDGHFIDARFVDVKDSRPAERRKNLPTDDITLLQTLRSFEGLPYVWGGNWHTGIQKINSYYPPTPEYAIANAGKNKQWTFTGVDCSGLLYEVTNGASPRNTSSLIEFGDPVAIEELNAEQIAAVLKPLDLIVWSGHLIIVLNNGQTIESRGSVFMNDPDLPLGVRIRKLEETLDEVMNFKKRLPVNDYSQSAGLDAEGNENKKFVVRRWLQS